jgi:mono/diheme cytochrome c family protein
VSFAVNGRQYIAASTGQAVSSGAALNLTPEIRSGRNNNLYVFALPEGFQSARVPPRTAPGVATTVTPAALPVAQSCRKPGAAAAANAPLFADGRFTAAQSEAGRRLFTEQQCTVCHGERMQGTNGAPALADEGFRRAWQGRPVKDLLDCTRNTMPPGRLGTLSDEQHQSLVAAILEANGLRPGGATR